MKTFERLLRRARQDERGAGLVEYALLVALIAVVCIGAVTFLGTSESGKLDKAGKGIGGETARQCVSGGLGPDQIHYLYDEFNPNTGYSNVAGPFSGPCP